MNAHPPINYWIPKPYRSKQNYHLEKALCWCWPWHYINLTKFFRTIRGTLEESAKQLDNGEDVIYYIHSFAKTKHGKLEDGLGMSGDFLAGNMLKHIDHSKAIRKVSLLESTSDFSSSRYKRSPKRGRISGAMLVSWSVSPGSAPKTHQTTLPNDAVHADDSFSWRVAGGHSSRKVFQKCFQQR